MRTYCIAQGTLLVPCGDLSGKEIQKEEIYTYIYVLIDSLCHQRRKHSAQ